MTKKHVNISIDEDVLQFIDELAKSHREERSRFLNRYFAEMMKTSAREPNADDQPKKKPKAASAGK